MISPAFHCATGYLPRTGWWSQLMNPWLLGPVDVHEHPPAGSGRRDDLPVVGQLDVLARLDRVHGGVHAQVDRPCRRGRRSPGTAGSAEVRTFFLMNSMSSARRLLLGLLDAGRACEQPRWRGSGTKRARRHVAARRPRTTEVKLVTSLTTLLTQCGQSRQPIWTGLFYPRPPALATSRAGRSTHLSAPPGLAPSGRPEVGPRILARIGLNDGRA